MSYYYGHPVYVRNTYSRGYPSPVYDEYDPYSDDEYLRRDRTRRNRTYNLHPFPTNGRPLGPVHRAAQAEGITLRHVQGCDRNGQCERLQRRQMIRELRRRGAFGQQLTFRQALRVAHGLHAGNPDRLPPSEFGHQASGHPQFAITPGGAAWGGNVGAGQSVQGNFGGGPVNGMIGGGGFGGDPWGGYGEYRGRSGGLGGYGRGRAIGEMNRADRTAGISRGGGMGPIGVGSEVVLHERPGGREEDMVFVDEALYHGNRH
ncbi:MAG: hypothetical protein Q9216_006281 [Gyalolechia sp. 2 TL-2023]